MNSSHNIEKGSSRLTFVFAQTQESSYSQLYTCWHGNCFPCWYFWQAMLIVSYGWLQPSWFEAYLSRNVVLALSVCVIQHVALDNSALGRILLQTVAHINVLAQRLACRGHLALVQKNDPSILSEWQCLLDISLSQPEGKSIETPDSFMLSNMLNL